MERIQTMRRILTVLTILGFLGTGFGCRHMAGVCDCAVGPVDHVAPLPPGTPAPPTAQPATAQPEPIKAMPKTEK
jgi:hypothetical protein